MKNSTLVAKLFVLSILLTFGFSARAAEGTVVFACSSSYGEGQPFYYDLYQDKSSGNYTGFWDFNSHAAFPADPMTWHPVSKPVLRCEYGQKLSVDFFTQGETRPTFSIVLGRGNEGDDVFVKPTGGLSRIGAEAYNCSAYNKEFIKQLVASLTCK